MIEHHRTYPYPLRAFLTAAIQGFKAVFLFIRCSVLNFSVMLPLLGAVSVMPRLTGAQVFGIIVVAVTFHIFAYVLNDVLDLPLDRTELLRRESPLVRGAIRPRQVLIFALMQIPLAFWCTVWLHGSTLAYGTLAVSFVAMAVYNIWGKRMSFPPFADAVQGAGWVALALYGVAVTGQPPTALMGALLVYVFVLVLMINGIHGALRDIGNDLQCGAHTTAILLGARPEGDLGVLLSARLKLYALVLQVFVLGSGLLPLLANWFGYPLTAWLVTMGIMALVTAATLYCFVRAYGSVGNRWNMILFGMMHLVLSLGAMVLPYAYYVGGALRVILLTVYILPVAVMWLLYGFKWG